MSGGDGHGRFFPSRPSPGRNAAWVAFATLVYFGVARLSLSLVFQPEGIAAIWPPEGVFLSAILLSRRGVRPYMAGALLVADFAAEMLAGTPFLVSAI